MRANCPSPGAPMRSNETEYPRECSDSPVSQASTLESRSTKSNATRTIGSPNYCEYLRREYVKNVATNMTFPLQAKGHNEGFDAAGLLQGLPAERAKRRRNGKSGSGSRVGWG